MNNDLFNQNLMKKLASDKELQLTVTKHDLIKEHLSKLEKGEFKSETSNYLYFYEIILKEILGYNLQENILFDEKEEVGRGKSEFVLKNGDKKFMVVELKGSDSDLDKPQNRVNDKRTPVDQAFDYAQHTGDIDWILVSNYNEFRLYNWHTKGKYISFTCAELLEKDVFSYFMLSFSQYSHISSSYADKLIQETILVEKKLEKNFYKLFHETRLMLLKEIEENNDLTREEAIHYAQLILNRYMFICFAEDIENLLPSQLSTQTLSKPIKDGDIGGTALWRRLNELFEYIDVGNEFKGISKYNGGLFKDDLSFLKIRDLIDDVSIFKETWQKWDFEKDLEAINELIGPHGDKINPIYKNLLVISSFDFSSELDVNILGHVFENSIGDIEELKADDRGRRKKDGVFYTPEYITDYICRNTIIPYLSLSGEANNVEELVKEYWGTNIDKLDAKLKNIKIVDPACGSGAFLNKAADVLLEIHEAIHEELYKENKSLDRYLDNIGQRREILLNNIYGVDLNEESVEITKLSLFLKVCKKGLAFPNLDDNIKCGNSLIDDKEFAGDKAFNWDDDFKAIFDDGGFDVVVGNPPWGADFDEISKKYIENNYNELEYQINSYTVFLEKSNSVLKPNGYLGFITPPTWLYMHYFKKIRKFLISKNTFKKIIYLKYHAFDEVTSESCVICYNKSSYENSSEIFNKIAKSENEFLNKDFSAIEQSVWEENYKDGFLFSDEIEIYTKFFQKADKLKTFCDLTTGIKPYQTNKGNPKQTREDVKNKIYSSNYKVNDDYKAYLVGGNIKRYSINYSSNQWLKYGPWIAEPRQSFDFNTEKIVIRRTSDKIFAAIDSNGFLDLNSVHNLINKSESILNLKFVLILLNSSLIDFVYRYLVPDEGRVFSEVKIINLEKLPIYPATPEEQEPFIEKADQMLELNKTLQNEINSFKEWLTYIFKVEKFSKKLEKYYELSLDEFLAELKKKKVDVKNRENFTSLKEEFEKSVSKIRPLLQEIEETDNEIDQMVYELYGLSDDEIRIIDDSLN